MDDCRCLERFLASASLLSKKSGDFELWKSALGLWTNTSLGAARWTRIPLIAEQLRRYRAPENVVTPSGRGDSPAYLNGFLAGFASAEAHFGATAGGHPRFTINLRQDDAPVLALLRDHTGLGRLSAIAPRASSYAATSWRVTSIEATKRLVTIFDERPPVGKALRTYSAWRDVVKAAGSHGHGHRRAYAQARRELALRLVETRAYQPPTDVIARPDMAAQRRRRAVDALTAWSRARPGPYTATRYEQWRRSELADHPNRDTVARSFGAWRSALEAAGLSTAHSRTVQTIGRSRASYRASREAFEAQRRRAVCEAIRTCAQSLGHEPRAMEFFRWRGRAASNSPTQATVYRAFPRGWSEALAAARRLS